MARYASHFARKVIPFHELDITFHAFYLTQLIINILCIAGVCFKAVYRGVVFSTNRTAS